MSEYHVAKPCATSRKVSATTVKQLCGPNEERTSITISTDGTIYVSMEADMASGQGLCVGAFIPVLQICQCHVGDFVKRALYFISPTSGGDANVYIVEGFEKWPSANQ